MALSYKARRRWTLIILLVGLPIYIVAAVTLTGALRTDPTAPPNIFLELLIYLGLGVIWAIPFKFIFRGVGQADPEAQDR